MVPPLTQEHFSGRVAVIVVVVVVVVVVEVVVDGASVVLV